MLPALERLADEALMLPEQCFAHAGDGTGSATPLAWARDEYILLERSTQDGRVLDLPSIVAERPGAYS